MSNWVTRSETAILIRKLYYLYIHISTVEQYRDSFPMKCLRQRHKSRLGRRYGWNCAKEEGVVILVRKISAFCWRWYLHKKMFRNWCPWHRADDKTEINRNFICFQTKRFPELGGSQAKVKDVERRQPKDVSSRNATLTGSNQSWRGNPFLKRTNFRNSQLSRPGNTQVPFYLNHLPVFCSICYRYSNVRSPRTQNQRWFASPYVIIEDFIAKSCLSLYEKKESKRLALAFMTALG